MSDGHNIAPPILNLLIQQTSLLVHGRGTRLLGAVSAGLERGCVLAAQYLWDGVVRCAVRDQRSVLVSLWGHNIGHV